ncbi:DEAD/DEAH box helicase family protein [Candidatus Gracilibacteria bacterium]|nr:DEAD/DEAH box helicase family protein [Candidatus Gracilibacteria bacterium]
MTTNTNEKDFQKQVLEHLENTGYTLRKTKSFNKDVCIDIELVLEFIQKTQKRLWDRFVSLYGDKASEKFIFRLNQSLENKGTIEVLKDGFKDSGCHFKLFYSKPNNNKNPDLQELFEANIFSVIDELEYEKMEMGNRIDLVVFINGLPITSIELKDTFSQGVEKAMNQYRYDRNPNETFFSRCLVHFAMSDEKIYMTAKLAGEKTRFLPFNRGTQNPEIKGDFKTSYLYKDILQKNKLSKLISGFIYNEGGINIFPRFHQLDCVNSVLNDVKVGNSYLIQHSAGSGKTKTIAWLAHSLLGKFDSDDNRLFDVVIVVSDRKVIDKQLQEQVQAIEKIKGIVEKIDKNSAQLKEALLSGTNIIVTTIQKFPYILDELGAMDGRKYAIIIDEAHSSQTGNNAKKMKQVLSTNSLEEAELFEEEFENEEDKELYDEMAKSKNLKNASFFAFTATPKNKTLELFGTKNEEGNYKPFHLYSMRQAMKEGFIMDVLKNYLSYETYFALFKKVEEDPKYDEKKAKLLLRNFVEKHPNTIARKTQIMLDHFNSSTRFKIGGKAKAMVVTRSRLHAVLYKKAFDAYIKGLGLNIKTLVAFSGTVKHDDVEYTENSLNGSEVKDIPTTFEKDDYKILIVANKFQTGFDEPLIHTMYVDKMLNGITAVQTLSRANRIYAGKNDTLVLDFANDTEVIKKAFEPYYEETYLLEGTDYNKLYELYDKLFDFLIFDQNEVEEYFSKYKSGANQAILHNILNSVVATFKSKEKEEQVDFKKTLKRFQSIYSFLSQLIPFNDIALEKLFIFSKFLTKKLPTINEPLPFGVLEDVDVDSYKIVNKGEKSISLEADGELDSMSSGGSGYIERNESELSVIIKSLNDTFGTDFTDEDKVFVSRMINNLRGNEDLVNKIKNNSKENVLAVFDNYFDNVMVEILDNNMGFYKKIVDNDKLKKTLKDNLFRVIYNENREKKY